jgi:16S rRNA (uracil1498-N3)-methyltransferase
VSRLYLPGAAGGDTEEARLRRATGGGRRPEHTIEIRGDDLHYVVDVLRLRQGDSLEVFDGRGAAYPARIVEVTARAARLALGERREAARPGARVTAVQALCKGEKMDWVVQKCVELGAARIVPLAAERSVVRLDAQRAASRVARWRKIAAEAARQCGRADVPEVAAVRSFADLGAELVEGETRVILHEGARDRLRPLLGGDRYALAIGPEGGFTEREVEEAHALGFRAASLGERILRTETVALAVLALVQHAAGDLG